MKKTFLILLFSIASKVIFAQWTDNTKPALTICNATDFQSYVYATADSLGNTFYLWTDFRNKQGDLYAQKLDARGIPQWTANGLKIGNIVANNSYFYSPKIIKPDNKGGAFITWQQAFDVTNLARRNIFGQYVNAAGTALWANGGLKISNIETLSDDISDTALDAAFEDGKIILFFNQRYSNGLQDVGFRQLNTNGLPVDNEVKLLQNFNENYLSYNPKLRQLVVLSGTKSASTNNYFVNRFPLYVSAVAVNAAQFSVPSSTTVRIDFFKTDADGNALVGRTNFLNASQNQIQLSKFSSQNSAIWQNIAIGSNGKPYDLQLLPTSDGGAIGTWVELSDKIHPFQVAKFDASGKISWQKDAFVANQNLNYILPNKLVTDGKDGAYTMWFTPKNVGYDLSLQYIDKTGNLVFGNTGKPITAWTFYSDWKLVAHPKGGVVTYYSANAENTNADATTFNMYANRMNENGNFGINNSLIINNIAKKDYFVGDSITVALTLSGDGFFNDNSFKVLLSDNAGSFANPREIGNNSSVKLPNDLAAGAYKIKVVSTSPVVESQNQLSFNVKIPTFSINNFAKTAYCVGDTLNVSIKADAIFQSDNLFKILLSDATGSFTNAKEIGRDSKQTISAKLPTDIAAGNYKIKMTASSPALESSNILSLTVKKSSPPTLLASQLTACAGVDSVSLTASGCDGGVILWSNALQGTKIKALISADVSFSATCTISGCPASAASDVLKISATPLPTATASNSGPYFEGDDVKLAGSGGTDYAWTGPNNFSSKTQNPTITKASLAAAGIYSVKVTNNNCSKSVTTEVKISPILANENPFETTFKTYPNPASQQIIVEFSTEFGKEIVISILDFSGKLMLQKQLKAIGGKQTEVLDIQQVMSKICLVRVKIDSQEIIKKVVIEK